MLFAVKNHVLATLAAASFFAAIAITIHRALGMTWTIRVAPGQLWIVLAAALLLALSDGGLHVLLYRLVKQPYRRRYRELVFFFRPQRAGHILAAGLLAGTEELLFRGLLLDWLRTQGGWSTWAAVAGSGLVFGLAHMIPSRALGPFAAWAAYEGFLLGWAYVATGSLGASMVLHALHDMAGFSLFAIQRRTGWMLCGSAE